MKSLRNLVWITQFAMAVTAPLVLCVLGAVWLKNHFQLGGWVVVPGIFLGLGGAISGAWSTLKAMQRSAEEEEGELQTHRDDEE